MKNLFTCIFLVSALTAIHAQTNVSGGIYTNTAWTLANSPYIIVDTIVVFPGVTLTVEPGVTVKFDDGKYMEIRQSTFIATGTASDSITITSNSASPVKAIFDGIIFTNPVDVSIEYCIFKYADYAMKLTTSYNDTIAIQHSSFYENNNCISNNYGHILINQGSFQNNSICLVGANYPLHVKNSEFNNNTNGIGTMWGNVEECFLDSCTFLNNQFGVAVDDHGSTSNCIFSNNGTAMAINDHTEYLVSNSTFCNNLNAIVMRAHQSHDTIINCNFSQNHIAISSLAPVDYIAGNILTDNDTALAYVVGGTDSVFNNYIFHNQVGILLGNSVAPTFFNNYICNNSIYNIMYTSTLNGSIPPVCFCETDSAAIRAKIFDGYVDITRGLLSFTPFIPCDSSAITALSPIICPAVIITDIENKNIAAAPMMEIYPNPSSGVLNIYLKENSVGGSIKIFNMLGELVYASSVENQTKQIDISTFESGVFIIEVTTNTMMRQKFIVEKSIR